MYGNEFQRLLACEADASF